MTIEISVHSSWGENCEISQVYKQAAEEALGIVKHAMTEARFSIKGEPAVTAVLVERKP